MSTHMNSLKVEENLVYQMTPELPFTPTIAICQHKNTVYKVGSVLPLTESRTMEYKTGGGAYPVTILPKHVQKYGSAFLNSGGGTLCVGVSDNGTVVGVRLRYSDRQTVMSIVREEFRNFSPSVEPEFYEVEFVPCNRFDIYVIEIHVRAGDPAEIYSDRENKMWVRRDGSVQGPLWPREIREIVISKFMKELADQRHSTAAPSDSNAHPLTALSTGTPVVGCQPAQPGAIQNFTNRLQYFADQYHYH